jgi:hypothetical protein
MKGNSIKSQKVQLSRVVVVAAAAAVQIDGVRL